MAVAWAYSICFVKFYDKTKEHFEKDLAKNSKQNNDRQIKIDKFTYNKSIQKAIESYRLSKEQKDELRNLKIK